MSNDLNRIIDVTITRETSVPATKGFGTVGFLSNESVFQGRQKDYAAGEIELDDLAGADAKAYASLYFSQAFKPEKLTVIKKGRDLPENLSLLFDADFITGNNIDVTLNSEVLTTVPFNTDQATTLSDVATEIATAVEAASATVNGTRGIDIVGANNGTDLVLVVAVTGGASQAGSSQTVTQYADTSASNTESLDEAINQKDEWYCLAAYTHLEADILALAAWTQSKFKIYMPSSADAGVIDSNDSSDVASQLQSSSYDRTLLLYSAQAVFGSFPDAAWAGLQLPKDPGSTQWAYKTLAGVTPDSLLSSEKNAALGKNANVYTTIAAVNVTEQGKTSGGEWVDVIRGADWITARIQEAVFTDLINEEKIPFTNAGADIIVKAVRDVLNQAVVNGIVSDEEEFTVTRPDVADVSASDKANRILPDVEFEATLAGAIIKTKIAGRLVL